jgi:hypothetical protein
MKKINSKRVFFLASVSIYCSIRFSFKYEPILRRFSCFDPSASIKKAVFIGEIETVRAVYVRASVTNFAVLKTVILILPARLVLSFTSGYFDKVRYHAGGDGLLFRANYFPTAGVEAGFDVANSFFIAFRSHIIVRT